MSKIIRLDDFKQNLALPLQGQQTQTPLGTANWHNSGGAVLRSFERGDFWLGRESSGKPLGFRDDRHVMLCSGTRGGKGISIIMPNLCTWLGSVVVIDPKGENAMVTARRRGNGSRYCWGQKQKVRILDPFNVVQTGEDDFADLKASFNPLADLHVDDEDSVEGASRIAEALIVSESSSEPFWESAAKELIKGIILHVVSWPNFLAHERNLATVRQLVMEGDARARKIATLNGDDKKKSPSGIGLLAAAMKRNQAFGGVVAQTGAMLADLEQSPKTMIGVLQSARTNTDFLASPGMKRCLASSSFSLSELKTDPKGVSVYLCLPQRYVETHAPWLRMMSTLIIAEMERVRRQPASGHPVLMVLDEFPALRRMRVLENAAAQIAGYGVKLVFTVQTLAQLKEIYKDNWETLIANAGVKLFFCNDDHFTRQYVSQLIGECEVVRTAQSYSHTKGESSSFTTSTSIGYSSGFSMGQSHGQTSNTNGGSDSTGMNSGWTSGYSTSTGTSSTYGSSSSDTRGISENIQKRPLVTPDEVGRMFGNREVPRALALISGYQPLALQRTSYFGEYFLMGNYDAHADHPLPLTLKQVVVKIRDDKIFAESRRIEAERRAAEEARRIAEDAEARRLAAKRKQEEDRRRLMERWHAQCRKQARWDLAYLALYYLVICPSIVIGGGLLCLRLLIWLLR